MVSGRSLLQPLVRRTQYAASANRQSLLPLSPLCIRRAFAGVANDTVVARCTHKIQSSLNPTFLKVLSSNDDPNGNHVSREDRLLIYWI
jgi:hypothetical protein